MKQKNNDFKIEMAKDFLHSIDKIGNRKNAIFLCGIMESDIINLPNKK